VVGETRHYIQLIMKADSSVASVTVPNESVSGRHSRSMSLEPSYKKPQVRCDSEEVAQKVFFLVFIYYLEYIFYGKLTWKDSLFHVNSFKITLNIEILYNYEQGQTENSPFGGPKIKIRRCVNRTDKHRNTLFPLGNNCFT